MRVVSCAEYMRHVWRVDAFGPGAETSVAQYVGIDGVPGPGSHECLLPKHIPTVGRACPVIRKAQEEAMAAEPSHCLRPDSKRTFSTLTPASRARCAQFSVGLDFFRR